MPKTVSLTDAQQQLTAATAAVDQLKAKLLDQGPGSVTAEELGQAALDVEHAKLTLAHAARQAEETAAAERLDQLQLLKQQILRDAGDVDQALDAMRQIEDGVATLVKACAGRQQLIAQAVNAMRRAAVPETGDTTDKHAGLGWLAANIAGGEAIVIDRRRIVGLNPAMLISAAIARGCTTAGYSTGHLRPILDVDGTTAVAQDPEAWMRKRF